MGDFRVIQRCPTNVTVAPYFAILVDMAEATVNSIYRGVDAEYILHKYGKHSQAELYRTLPPGFANPPGRSTHERKSDGVAYPSVPVGHSLPWWCEGMDVNDSDVPHLIAAAHSLGWELFRPYPSGIEYHHVNFKRQPRARNPRELAHVISVRHSLPHS